MDEASLLASAGTFAEGALNAWGEGDLDIAMLNAGVSFEHLCKAALYRRASALIAASDFDSLLHLTGQSSFAKKTGKTIGASDAFERCVRLLPGLGGHSIAIHELIQLRNGVAHAANYPQQHLEAVLAAWTSASRILLADLGQNWTAHFGDQANVASALEEKRNAAVIASVNRKLEAARRFVAHLEQFGEQERASIIEISEEAAPRRWPGDESIQDALCPACHNTARVRGEVDVEWEPEWDVIDGESVAVGMVGTAFFMAGTLNCPICKLELDGDDELEAASIDTRWELRDATDDEYRDYYQSDWE